MITITAAESATAASVLVAIAVFLLAAFGALVTFAPMGKLRASMAHSH